MLHAFMDNIKVIDKCGIEYAILNLSCHCFGKMYVLYQVHFQGLIDIHHQTHVNVDQMIAC